MEKSVRQPANIDLREKMPLKQLSASACVRGSWNDIVFKIAKIVLVLQSY